MSKLNPHYSRGDVLYFYKHHLLRMKQIDGTPIDYAGFYSRLKRGMTLKEAIYTPRKKTKNKINMKPNKFKNFLFRFISFFK